MQMGIFRSHVLSQGVDVEMLRWSSIIDKELGDQRETDYAVYGLALFIQCTIINNRHNWNSFRY